MRSYRPRVSHRIPGRPHHAFLLLTCALCAAGAHWSYAQNASGGWISWNNGAANARRAPGQLLRGNWQEVWRAPRAAVNASTSLVSDGLIVYQDDAMNPDRFACRDLRDGALRWRHITGPTRGDHMPGCIVGGRVFLPLSSAGFGSAPHLTQRVECLDLQSGQLLWTWTWNPSAVGGISALQALPWDPTMGGSPVDRVLLTVSRKTFNATSPYETSVLTLDAGAMAVPSVLASGAVVANSFNCIPPSAFGAACGARGVLWNAFHHEQFYDQAGNLNWYSNALRVHRLQTMGDPGAPFTASPALSGRMLSSRAGYHSHAPMAIHEGLARGFLMDTAGVLHAYDLARGIELWSAPIPTGDHHIFPHVLSDLVVIIDRYVPKAWAFEAADDGPRLRWQRSYPVAISHDTAVLDGDVIFLRLGGGVFCGLDASGEMLEPVHTAQPLWRAIPSNGLFLGFEASALIAYKAVELIPQSAPRIGARYELLVASPADANLAYLFAFSFGPPQGIPLADGRSIPLSPDPLFILSTTPGAPFFANTFGVLDISGHATACFDIPPLALLSGRSMCAAFVVLDPAASLGIRSISPALCQQIR